jgi:hypothetical protein
VKCPRCQHENRAGRSSAKSVASSSHVGAATVTQSSPHRRSSAPSVAAPLRSHPPTRFTSPDSYTPKHLAEKILTSKAALEGERKQVTVLFADLKGSMLRLLPFVFGGRAGRMESSLWMGLLPSAGASVEIDTSRMAMLHLASRAIRDRGL